METFTKLLGRCFLLLFFSLEVATHNHNQSQNVYKFIDIRVYLPSSTKTTEGFKNKLCQNCIANTLLHKQNLSDSFPLQLCKFYFLYYLSFKNRILTV